MGDGRDYQKLGRGRGGGERGGDKSHDETRE